MFGMYTIIKTQYMWLVWAIIAITLLIGFYLSYRITLLKTKYDFTPPIIFQFLGALMIIPLSLLFKEPFPFFSFRNGLHVNYYTLGIFMLSGIFYAIHDRTQATVRKNVDVAIAGTIDLSVHIFLILFGLLLFREKLILHKILGIILVLIANFNVTYDFNKHKLNKYLSIGLLANLAYATGILIDINLSNGKNLPFYLFMSYIMGGLYVFTFSIFDESAKIKQILNKILQDFNKKTIIPHLSTSFFSVFYTFAMLTAYRYGQVAITTTVISSTVIFNTILAAIFLKEKRMLALKISSAIIGVIGIILVIIG